MIIFISVPYTCLTGLFYQPVPKFPQAAIEQQLQNILVEFSPILRPHKALYRYLTPKSQSTQPPKFYGIPKIHKEYNRLPPIRPIVSHSGSLLCASATFIDHVLQPLAHSYDDYLHNSTTLISSLQSLCLPDDAILVTIDVESLFPSIPQDECLSIVYNEMFSKAKLLLFDPNLIIKLLHININSNYFEFGSLVFRQVQGTAMGASFSPTISNIFLSTILRFLQTQMYEPKILKRYIDDIFLIWTDCPESLKQFLNSLNTFHHSLKFTWTQSQTAVDYLDTTIYKGPLFQITNLLDIKTYRKPKNLYQYLFYTSSHPQSVFNALIKGECVRYVRTNYFVETYTAATQLFKQRLLKREYPRDFIEKTINLVAYSQRQRYLKNKAPKLYSTPRPLFKCIAPLQFSALKCIILERYHCIQRLAPGPRFVSLKCKTLGQELIRARIHPTDEQFLDLVTLVNNDITVHTAAGKMPPLRKHIVHTVKCNRLQCTTCTHLDYFQSTSTKKTYPIHQSYTCTSTNIIYLITCTKCRKQYVGQTTTSLRERINRHRSSIFCNERRYISLHFNFKSHKVDNLSVQIIDQAEDVEQLEHLETFWQLTLNTLIPKGLNVRLGSRSI